MKDKTYLKRAVILLLLPFIFLSVFSQEKKLSGQFTLRGDLTNYKDIPEKLMVSIIKPTGGRTYDSVLVVGSKFKFQMVLDEPSILLFYVQGKRRKGSSSAAGGNQDNISVFAVPSTNKLVLRDSMLNTALLKGNSSAPSDAYNQLYNRHFNVKKQATGLIAKLQVKDDVKSQHIIDSLTQVADNKILIPFIQANPNSPVSVKVLLDYASRPVWQPRKNLNPDEIDALLKSFSPTLKVLPSMQALDKSIQIAKLTQPGKIAMDFVAMDVNGKRVQLSDFRGKYVFIDFWASWCVPCRKENPNLKRLYEQYKDKGLIILSVSLDVQDKREAWLKAIKDDGINQFVHVSELNGFESSSAVLYDVKSIPTNFIIGPDGKFIARNIYGEELFTKFAELFLHKTQSEGSAVIIKAKEK